MDEFQFFHQKYLKHFNAFIIEVPCLALQLEIHSHIMAWLTVSSNIFVYKWIIDLGFVLLSANIIA